MSTRSILAITFRLLAQARRDPLTLGLLFASPLLILGLLFFLMRTHATPPSVDVVNLDRGQLGAAAAARLEQSTLIHAVEASDVSSAQRRLRAGKTAAYVLFPAEFSDGAIGGALKPEVRLDGSEPGPKAPVLQAVSEATASAAGAAGPRPPARLEVDVTYEHGAASLDVLDYFGGAFIALVLFFLVFVITSIAFLRERTQGTLERLMASALRRGEIVIGYMLAFTLLGLLQASELLIFALWVLKIYNQGPVAMIFLVEVLVAVSAVNLGILVSMMARTEFQATQSIPIIIGPQLLLSGTIFSVSTEPGWLQAVSHVLPLTYAVYAMRDVMVKGADLTYSGLQLDAGVLLGFCVLTIVLAALTLRRNIV